MPSTRGLALLLLACLCALLALQALALLLVLFDFSVRAQNSSGILSLPVPPPAAPRDPWTPLRAGLRHLARTRGGGEARLLGRMYEERSFRPFWVTPLALSQSGRSLMTELSSSTSFQPEPHRVMEIVHLYRLAFPETLEPDRHSLAELDWELSHTFMSYASTLLEGRAPWAEARASWHFPARSLRMSAVFRTLEERGALRTLRALEHSHERYTRLGAALAEYRELRSAGGWPTIEGGDPLAAGDRSSRVRALRRRLAITGELPSAGDSSIFDAELERAIRSFQKRHGIETDGRVGPKTLEALNVPVEARIRQLEINLERRRWLPGSLGGDFIWVNIPEFRLRAFRDGREVLRMPVVVGSPSNPTPTFHDRIDHAVLNPYWYVPERIALNELAPKARRDPGYLVRANFELLDEKGSPLPPNDLASDLLRSGQHRLRRRPGPQNDLGRIKFGFPNRFQVYLHDTPARHLFERAARAASHGCVRVGRPLALAEHLFQDRFPELEADLETGANLVMRLDEPVPIYFVYFTAWREEDGTVQFRDDVYGTDEELALDLPEDSPPKPIGPVLRLLWPSLG